jgi:hypothetical protein
MPPYPIGLIYHELVITVAFPGHVLKQIAEEIKNA